MIRFSLTKLVFLETVSAINHNSDCIKTSIMIAAYNTNENQLTQSTAHTILPTYINTSNAVCPKSIY